MSTYSTDDIVVFLPGILGSVLKKDGHEVWGTSSGAMLRALLSRGDSVRSLTLTHLDDPSLDDLGDGVEPTALFPDVHLVPGLWKIDGYTRLLADIGEAFGLVEGTTLFPFPYDWRRDNRVAARRLATSVKAWVEARRKDRPGARAVLVAHSMGGLVARHYLEVLGGWEHVRALVTMGTPFGGSPKALGFLVDGMRPGKGPVRFDLSELVRSFTSVYQLLPTYECIQTAPPGLGSVDAGAERPLRLIGDVPDLPLDHARVAAALAFHDEIAAKVTGRPANPAWQVSPIVGIEQPTVQSAAWDGAALELLSSKGGEDEGGDGTVPRVSAVPFELADAAGEMFAAETHGSLQNHDAVLAHLRGVLSRPTGPIRRTRGADRVALALTLEDAVATGEAVVVTVRPAGGRQPALAATLTRSDGAHVDSATLLRHRDGSQSVTFDALPEGFYRVKVTGAGNAADLVSPVSDVFAVVGGAA